MGPRTVEITMNRLKRKHKTYLQSVHWQRVRQYVMECDGGRCVLCNRKAVDVHHRSYKHLDDFEREACDCVSLCKRCHKLFHDNVKLKSTPPALDDFVQQPDGSYSKK